MRGPAVVGRLKCQTDSTLRQLTTTVVSCTKGKSGFTVEFEDTVLFPEGGGQPCDYGTCQVIDRASLNGTGAGVDAAANAGSDGTEKSIDLGESDLGESAKKIPVTNVQRSGLHAMHSLAEALPLGAAVNLAVDWPRRRDHMQQHTGQHLLSAVLDKLGVSTVGWSMGNPLNYVELDRKLTDQEVLDVQQQVNEWIEKSVPITVTIAQDEGEVDHHVPDDYDLDKGALRVVTIGELDKNPCCGTHLQTSAEIGSLLLLNQVPNKGTNSRLFFTAGDRTTTFAAGIYKELRTSASALSCQPLEVSNKVDQLYQKQRALAAQLKSANAQLAVLEGAQLRKDAQEAASVAVLHKSDAEADYLKLLEKEIGKDIKGTVLLLTGEGSRGGAVVIIGSDVDAMAAKVKDTVANVKGGGKGRWQGKVVKYEKNEVEKLLQLASSP